MSVRRFVVVVDLDDEKLTDRERDLLAACDGAVGREQAIRHSFAVAFPSLDVLAVSETEHVKVVL